MAQIHPAGWRELAVTGAAQREIETLAVLAASLSDDYVVYHGVHWTKADKSYSAYGEADFIIVAPNGRVLLIEQKSGFLEETPEGLVKNYQGKKKGVRVQIIRTVENLRTRFGRSGDQLFLDYLLYCPDYTIRQPHIAGIDSARIVDASRREHLVDIIRALLPADETTPQRDKVLHFLGDALELMPDAGAMAGRAVEMVTRVSGGLATWARRLEFEPFRLRVIGTAGSGKTQLALAEFRAAVDAGKRPLYVCYNRPLADHMQRLAPSGGSVTTFHMLCDAFAREQGIMPDYAMAEVFAEMEQVMLRADIADARRYDVLIVDEGQDFTESWRDAVLRLLRPGGRAIWLEDPMQNLYGRETVRLDGWVTLRSASNYRSPRQIVELLADLRSADIGAEPVEAASPFQGAEVDFLTYRNDDTQDMYDNTKQAITLCLGASFSRSDIALISWHGREKSALLKLDRLGTHALKSFTGEYDIFGNPMFREGELLAESLYRFKGQSAAAVILTEIDFEALDERAWRKLFVGMTRARLKLILVLSERAASCMLAR